MRYVPGINPDRFCFRVETRATRTTRPRFRVSPSIRRNLEISFPETHPPSISLPRFVRSLSDRECVARMHGAVRVQPCTRTAPLDAIASAPHLPASVFRGERIFLLSPFLSLPLPSSFHGSHPALPFAFHSVADLLGVYRIYYSQRALRLFLYRLSFLPNKFTDANVCTVYIP